MNLSIVIVNWKSAGYLAACLDSIAANPPQVAWECIVIDNASFDGSAKLCRARFPFVTFIQENENLGFAKANNRAAARASGAALLFLNPDTIVKPGALQVLYDGLMNDPLSGAAGPCLHNGDGSLQTTCVLPFPSIVSEVLDWEPLKRATRNLPLWGTRALYGKSNTPRTVNALSGASLMVRRSLFEKVNGFSADYFMYAEDIDLCTKIRKAGGSVTYVGKSEIIHFGGASSKMKKERFFQAVMLKESNRILLKKFKGPHYALLYRVCMGASAAVRLLLLSVLVIPLGASGRGAFGKWFAILRWSMGSAETITKTS